MRSTLFTTSASLSRKFTAMSTSTSAIAFATAASLHRSLSASSTTVAVAWLKLSKPAPTCWTWIMSLTSKPLPISATWLSVASSDRRSSWCGPERLQVPAKRSSTPAAPPDAKAAQQGGDRRVEVSKVAHAFNTWDSILAFVTAWSASRVRLPRRISGFAAARAAALAILARTAKMRRFLLVATLTATPRHLACTHTMARLTTRARLR
eukprot:CAMPEP_0171701382 /NCGR_PEP_ID=MMETSP0991-20121206/11027_1 /TAXON_ID=483369 /ORGANISM="non described non described, Strain CCMP2098" /LENGTH=207 /DNA_ID=CAMNT_0012290643 /DNA_START=314 /DNA_END=933 /DNA_ORIENTATION=+